MFFSLPWRRYPRTRRPLPSRRLRPAFGRGLTLVEVLVAIFVVSVGVLGTLASLWYGIRAERYAERRTAAVFTAREMLNQIRSQNLPFTPASADAYLKDGDYDDDSDDRDNLRAFNAAPFENNAITSEQNFQRHIEMKVMSTDENNYLCNIAAVKVILYWNEGSSEKKVTVWALHRRPS